MHPDVLTMFSHKVHFFHTALIDWRDMIGIESNILNLCQREGL
ncbi:hypothetical protein A8990_1558 [Paenibacillus taihuensis]|uniref:Uncharacterized protein n=1 Tax=Paenibacillus taihuensis TaxID=1156355 RepID=A0A3D9Q4P7_9BACL|nr:hypothetical protein A8990_1558 [Paenibacillus taihuensis]